MGADPFSLGMVYFISMAINASGTPIVAFVDTDSGDIPGVMAYTGGTWSDLGTGLPSITQAEYTHLALRPTDGTPYLVFDDDTVSAGWKATVMAFDGSTATWSPVGGSAGISSGRARYTRLAFNAGGTPYIVYSDAANGDAATLLAFSGGVWGAVGGTGFTSGPATYTSLAIASDGTPIVAYINVGNSNKASAMEFRSGLWSSVGLSFSPGPALGTRLALSPVDGSPHVSFQDDTTKKATVVKFSGTAWGVLGVADFTPALTSPPDLALNSAGTPHLSAEAAATSTLTTYVFSSGAWTALGASPLRPDPVLRSCLAIDASGVPYVAFADDRSLMGQRCTVMKFA